MSGRNHVGGALFAAALVAGVNAPALVHAQTEPIGPVFPAPGGTSFSSTGDGGLAGGQTVTLDSDNDLASVIQLWWGPSKDLFFTGPAVGSAMDGIIDAPGESMTLTSFSADNAVWEGTTTLVTSTGVRNVDTRFRATILSVSPGFVASNTVLIDPAIAPVVAEITADPFQFNFIFEARFEGGTTYTPFRAFFDTNCAALPSCENLAQMSVQGGLFYSPVPAVSDFNADGMSDILWRNDVDGRAAIWQMNGLFLDTGRQIGQPPVAWRIEEIGDFNDDGHSDILWRNTSSREVVIWRMENLLLAGHATIGFVDTAWAVKGIGDFDGDDLDDILWHHTDGRVAIWRTDGFGFLSGNTVGQPPVAWRIVGVGDFNLDGKSDIVWHNEDDGRTAVWEMNGFTVQAGRSLGQPPVAWKVEGVADFTGDNQPDLLWRNSLDGSTVIWQMNGYAFAASAGFGLVDGAWRVVRLGDHNGGGQADILWRNDVDGRASIWQMSGLTLEAARTIVTAPDWTPH